MIGSEDFFVYGMNAATGHVQWKYETGLGIASSPAAANGAVVIGGKDGYLYALELATGKLKWKMRVSDVITAPPVFGSGVIYLQCWGLMALNPEDGKVLWRAGLGGSLQGAPIVIGKTVYLVSGGGDVYALE